MTTSVDRHTTSLISVSVRFISEVNPSPLVYRRRHTTSLISVAVRFISEVNPSLVYRRRHTTSLNLTATDMSDVV
jgi:hypothetical protein